MNEHEKWQSRRLYHETFGTPGTVFPSWRGEPDRCKCGCGETWYDRVSPTNWLATMNPAKFISIILALVRVFVALHKVIWHLPALVWWKLKMTRAGYEREVMNRIQPGTNASVAMATVRLFYYGIIVPLMMAIWATAWILSRPGVVVMVALFLPIVGLVAVVFSITFVISLIAISMSGLVFILGGVGSIFYLDNPAIGITFIVIGVVVQYELHRREGKRREEQLGYLILMLRPQTRIDP